MTDTPAGTEAEQVEWRWRVAVPGWDMSWSTPRPEHPRALGLLNPGVVPIEVEHRTVGKWQSEHDRTDETRTR